MCGCKTILMKLTKKSVAQFSSGLRQNIKTGHAPLAWPGPKVRLASFWASILASTQILAWPQKLAWPQIWPLNFFFTSVFFFRIVIYSVMYWSWFQCLIVYKIKRLLIFLWLIFFSICYWSIDRQHFLDDVLFLCWFLLIATHTHVF